MWFVWQNLLGQRWNLNKVFLILTGWTVSLRFFIRGAFRLSWGLQPPLRRPGLPIKTRTFYVSGKMAYAWHTARGARIVLTIRYIGKAHAILLLQLQNTLQIIRL